MNWYDLLRSACHGLFQHKLRTALTVCGVALGSLLLFCSISGGIGVIRTVNERLGIGDRLLEILVSSGFLIDDVTADQARDAGFTEEMSDERRVRMATASGIGGRRNVPLDMRAAEQLRQMKHVAGAWPRIDFSAALFSEETQQWSSASVRAVQPNAAVDEFLHMGRTFSSETAHEVIVSELFLYHLGIRSDEDLQAAVGSKVRFVLDSGSIVNEAKAIVALEMDPNLAPEERTERRAELQGKIEAQLSKAKHSTGDFTIVGVLRALTREEARFHPHLANTRKVLMPHRPAEEVWQQINAPNRRVQVVVRADKPENVARLEESLAGLGYRTDSMAALALQIRSAVVLITAVITAIALAALMISGIGITNTMVMNVLERRREIAIMKSIGAQDVDIKRIFLLEGMLIGLVGGLAGLALGRLFCQLTRDYIHQLLEWRLKVPFGDDIFAFPIWLLLITPLVATSITTIASALPARQAARVDPVATLRAL